MTLKDHFFLSFERFPQRIAFSQPTGSLFQKDLIWRSFTYKDIEDLSARLAGYLHKKVSQGDRVLLYAENSVYWCIAYIAIILRGAIAVPLDADSDRDTVEMVIKDSGITFVLYSEKTALNVKDYDGFNIEKVEELPSSDNTFFMSPQRIQ